MYGYSRWMNSPHGSTSSPRCYNTITAVYNVGNNFIQIHKCRPTEINGFQSSTVFNINIHCAFVSCVVFTTKHRSSSVSGETSNAVYWTLQFPHLVCK